MPPPCWPATELVAIEELLQRGRLAKQEQSAELAGSSAARRWSSRSAGPKKRGCDG